MTGTWIALLAYGGMMLGALAIIPILLIIMMIPVGAVGMVISLYERRKWK